MEKGGWQETNQVRSFFTFVLSLFFPRKDDGSVELVDADGVSESEDVTELGELSVPSPLC